MLRKRCVKGPGAQPNPTKAYFNQVKYQILKMFLKKKRAPHEENISKYRQNVPS